jgi:tetratricopeptide (TPR) repeat protein
MRHFFLLLIFAFLTAIYASETDALVERMKDSYTREAAGDYQGAFTALGTVRLGQPQEYLLQLRSGWLLYCLGHYQRAILSYEAAIQRSPQSIEAKLGLILPLIANGTWDEVERVSHLVLRSDPNNFTANRWLIESYLAQGHPREASDITERLIERFPADPTIMELLARSRSARMDRTGARDAYQRLLLLSPSNVAALTALKEW